jgi:DNA-binding GntR family transcriptional regulator
MACVAAEHKTIADALEKRNLSLASELLKKHFEQEKNNMLERA